MNYANIAEAAANGVGFCKQIISKTTSGSLTTTTIYAGKSPQESMVGNTELLGGWHIRRTVVVENSSTGSTEITEGWATGAWNDRDTLTYKYQR